MANANRQRLVDYKQQYMFPDTLLESIYANDDQNSISGKDAILQAILTPDVYNSASNDNIYAVKKNGAAINIDYINKDIIRNLSTLNYGAASTGSILTINSNGVFGIQKGAEVKVDNAKIADEAKKVQNALSIKIGTGDNDIVVFDGSEVKSVTKVVDAVNSTYATKLGSFNAPLRPGLPYIDKNEANGTVSLSEWPTLEDGEKKLPIFSRSGDTYSVGWENGNDLGGGVKRASFDSNAPYYILGTASYQDVGVGEKITTAAISNGSPYFKGANLYQTSDETLKHFTEDLKVDLDNLSTIKKGLFYWNDDENKTVDIGVSAQSVEPLYPQIVTETDGIKAVSYSKLSVVALAAIDVLYKRVKELEEEVKILKNNK